MKKLPNVILIGFQMSGKTTIGRALAQHLNRPFIDTDQSIEAAHPPFTCREIFKQQGETYFREYEKQIRTSLNELSHHVIAVGGGFSLEGFQKQDPIIYLKTSFSILQKRLALQSPAYLGVNTLEDLYQARIINYEKWATHTLDMDSLTIEEAVNELKGEYDGF